LRKSYDLSGEEFANALTCTGLILVAFELVRSLIIKPIRNFYTGITFGDGMPFKSYKEDVLSRNRNEFEACLLYLRDFMKVIDSNDIHTIQALREQRNDLAHNLASRIDKININNYAGLLENAKKALFKLSNHNTILEIGADPELQKIGIAEKVLAK
jgi:hypothetical protein